MKIFSTDYLDGLTAKAQVNPRKRQHQNIHESYEDPCQRLFNAIEPGNIRPHRHPFRAVGDQEAGVSVMYRMKTRHP